MNFFPRQGLSKFLLSSLGPFKISFFLESTSRNYFFLDFHRPHPRSLMVVPYLPWHHTPTDGPNLPILPTWAACGDPGGP